MIESLRVYPKHGFLNTEYKVRSEGEDSFTIFLNGQTVFKGDIKAGETKVLPKLKTAGDYTIISNRTNERQQVRVEDALRLGSSELKQAYVFDEYPYIIFVMKDRFHLYDPSIETYVYTENYLCPNDIKHVNDGLLLFSTKHSSGMSLSIFNTNKLCIEYSLEAGGIVAHSKDMSQLYVLDRDGSSISIIRTEDLSTEAGFENTNSNGQEFYYVDEENELLYIAESDYFYAINMDDKCVKRFKANNVVGITKTGFIITNCGYQYEYEDLKKGSTIKGVFNYNPIASNICIDGLAFSNAEWRIKNEQAKKTNSYSNTIQAFAQECKQKIALGDESTRFTKEMGWDEISISAEFYPSKEGAYIIEKIEHCHANSITYYKHSNKVSSPNYKRRGNIIWISNLGYETIFSLGTKSSTYYDSIWVKNDQALFAVNSSLYIVLRNGEIISKHNNKAEVKEFFSSKAQTPAPIILDGCEIPTYRIICRSNNKLICNINDQYCLCEKSDLGWQNIKSIDFEKEKHNKAKMSSDGKYLVYSKGGNKYALYNIIEQKEETVLTGNFVDFDKTGKLLFMEDAKGDTKECRQLRIYNPINFEWEKGYNAKYYTFISPDGKLYAKTGLKGRYFNLLDNKEITREEFDRIKKEYDMVSPLSKEEIEVLENRRKVLLSQYEEYFKRSSNNKDKWIENVQKSSYPHFSSLFLKVKQFVVIGVVGAKKELEIEINTPLSFLNYVSFSYDNKYLGIVGKPGTKGYLKIAEINYDESSHSLSFKRNICDIKFADWATWTCAFTKNGLFGTYDSAPNLYLIETSDFGKFDKDNTQNLDFIRNNFQIKDRSLLCFSPSGRLMATSNQGYEALSLGGCGHEPSNDVYIYNTETREILSQWHDQGERIAYRNVTFAGFSIDESKLMTLSLDGVIVVRNINESVRNKVNNTDALATAS